MKILIDICNARYIDLIKRIPLPVGNMEDSWFMLPEEKGQFMVKSCYRKLQGEFTMPQTSFWKKVWTLKLPGKVINFAWRACIACLPTAIALLKKKVQIDVNCSGC